MGSIGIESSVLSQSLDAILQRVATTLEETDDEFPYFANLNSGNWETTENGNWCGGHWIGLLWLAAEYAEGDRRQRFEEAARAYTKAMVDYMPNQSMFRGMNFHYAGFRAYGHSGDRSLFGIGLEGADSMRAAYNEQARQIPLGELAIKGPEQFRGPESEEGPSGNRIGAVDNIYTAVPVLLRAFNETGDPQFRDVAVSHADRHLDWYLRDDGSTWHHAVFDPETGSLERQYNELADSDESCWARGQGWNIAGLARVYRETKAERYLDALRSSVRYHQENTREDEVPHWDYDVAGDEPRDTSAAGLIAYGLSRLPIEEQTEGLRSYGLTVLENLLDEYLVTDPSENNLGAITSGCFNRPGRYGDNHELIWTNYYVAKTIADIKNNTCH